MFNQSINKAKFYMSYFIYSEENVKALKDVFENHSFEDYRQLTTTYKAAEAINLSNTTKLSMLKHLSIGKVPTSFNKFWIWFKEKHGMEMAKQFCQFLFPVCEKTRQYMVNCMRNKKEHEFWNQIKSRVYKMWCSIVTETQCIFAVQKAINEKGLDWKIISSAELDSAGTDFVLVTGNKIVPIQIKKDTHSKYASNKKNTLENFSTFELKGKNKTIVNSYVNKLSIEKELTDVLLVKYDVPNSSNWKNDTDAPYEYLSKMKNGFVYFKGESLLNKLIKFVN